MRLFILFFGGMVAAAAERLDEHGYHYDRPARPFELPNEELVSFETTQKSIEPSREYLPPENGKRDDSGMQDYGDVLTSEERQFESEVPTSQDISKLVDDETKVDEPTKQDIGFEASDLPLTENFTNKFDSNAKNTESKTENNKVTTFVTLTTENATPTPPPTYLPPKTQGPTYLPPTSAPTIHHTTYSLPTVVTTRQRPTYLPPTAAPTIHHTTYSPPTVVTTRQRPTYLPPTADPTTQHRTHSPPTAAPTTPPLTYLSPTTQGHTYLPPTAAPTTQNPTHSPSTAVTTQRAIYLPPTAVSSTYFPIYSPPTAGTPTHIPTYLPPIQIPAATQASLQQILENIRKSNTPQHTYLPPATAADQQAHQTNSNSFSTQTADKFANFYDTSVENLQLVTEKEREFSLPPTTQTFNFNTNPANIFSQTSTSIANHAQQSFETISTNYYENQQFNKFTTPANTYLPAKQHFPPIPTFSATALPLPSPPLKSFLPTFVNKDNSFNLPHQYLPTEFNINSPHPAVTVLPTAFRQENGQVKHFEQPVNTYLPANLPRQYLPPVLSTIATIKVTASNHFKQPSNTYLPATNLPRQYLPAVFAKNLPKSVSQTHHSSQPTNTYLPALEPTIFAPPANADNLPRQYLPAEFNTNSPVLAKVEHTYKETPTQHFTQPVNTVDSINPPRQYLPTAEKVLPTTATPTSNFKQPANIYLPALQPTFITSYTTSNILTNLPRQYLPAELNINSQIENTVLPTKATPTNNYKQPSNTYLPASQPTFATVANLPRQYLPAVNVKNSPRIATVQPTATKQEKSQVQRLEQPSNIYLPASPPTSATIYATADISVNSPHQYLPPIEVAVPPTKGDTMQYPSNTYLPATKQALLPEPLPITTPKLDIEVRPSHSADKVKYIVNTPVEESFIFLTSSHKATQNQKPNRNYLPAPATEYNAENFPTENFEPIKPATSNPALPPQQYLPAAVASQNTGVEDEVFIFIKKDRSLSISNTDSKMESTKEPSEDTSQITLDDVEAPTSHAEEGYHYEIPLKKFET